MRDSQKKQKINKSAQIRDSQKPFSSITLKKDSRGGSFAFTSFHDIVQSIEREPSHSPKQLSEGTILAQQQSNINPLI